MSIVTIWRVYLVFLCVASITTAANSIFLFVCLLVERKKSHV